jgi:group I intron endonuclease
MQTDYKNSSNKPGIYKITNLINGKVYIGSAKRFKSRCQGHIGSLNKNKHQNKHLQNAINLYGTENFLFEVIEVMEGSTRFERTTREQEYIDQYLDRWEDCYNIDKKCIRKCNSLTPEETKQKLSKSLKGKHHSEETKRKISEAQKGDKHRMFGKHLSEEQKKKIGKTNSVSQLGKKHSEETKQKLREIFSGENHPMFGKERSDETRKKISEANKNKPFSEEHLKHLRERCCKRIIAIELNNNNFERVFGSLKEAEIFYNISSSKICQILKGHYKTTKNKTLTFKFF